MSQIARRRRSLIARTVCAGLAAALLTSAPGPAADAAGTTDPGACFTRFSGAWKSRSTNDVVRCIERKGKALFLLFGYPVSGKPRLMGPEQARETFKAYFKKIALVGLKDVSPRKSPKSVRLYEYTYKATGQNARTTHLQVKLKRDKKRLWVLDSVTESAKPRR